ncbi:MAG: nucleotidyltransferase domain-containing protein [Oscillochloris sp.]|nr:nucleotidyltransferase domain-containing protein [Oscillochloris sp.]
MEPATRIQFGRDLAARLRDRYGAVILLFGMLGSSARGEATEWSDVDLLAVTTDATIASRTLIYQGAPVVLHVISEADLTAALRKPGLSWPYWMGVLAEVRPLLGDRAAVARWQALGTELDDTEFQQAVEPLLPELVFESYGRIRSSAARNNRRDAAHAAVEVIYELRTALCLLNRRYVTRDYFAGIEQTFAFRLQPDDYPTLVTQLWDAHELEAIVPPAGKLMAAYWRLLAACGLNIPNYQRVNDLPL